MARRPPGVDQQGQAPKPSAVENAGGLGGGPRSSADRGGALKWAGRQHGTDRWAWRCERFVEEAYGTNRVFATAAQAAASLRIHHEPISRAPRGALVFFRPDQANRGWGHVGLSMGDGRMISALRRVTITDVAKDRYWKSAYVGWADAPVQWPGRVAPLPPHQEPANPVISIRITGPAPGQTISGIADIFVSAKHVSGVALDVYYADDPRDATTRHWHQLGFARRTPAGWQLAWNTLAIKDQGQPSWNTVTIEAVALDATGRRTGNRDVRRFVVDNTTGVSNVLGGGSSGGSGTPGSPAPSPAAPVPAPAPTPNPAPGPTTDVTYPETTGGNANTWTSYATAGGTQGPTIAGYTTVQIACKVTGFRVADGNTWWYRIASSPWSHQFYASADAFYNNGQTSGSLHGTPFVDPAVPSC